VRAVTIIASARNSINGNDMASDDTDKIDELVNDLDDLKTTVEELQNDPPDGIHSESLDKLKGAMDEAMDAADVLEDEVENLPE